MRTLDWLDILVHIAAAAGIYLALTLWIGLYPWQAAGVNAVFWFLREMYQQWQKGKPMPPWNWSLQKHLEWIAPTATGAILVIT